MARKTSPRKQVGTRIRDLRRQRRWSQGHLGERVGLTKQGVSRIELAQVATDLDQLGLFAHALGVPVASLLSAE